MKKLYFIEKEKFLCDAVAKLCKLKGLECYTTDTGEDSEYLISDMAPDLLLIDYDTVSGYIDDLIETLRSDSVSQIPVVFIESKEVEMNEELLSLGRKAISKPLNVETLVDELFGIQNG